MRLGIDLDNTIVRYDALFHRIACEQGLIPTALPATKEAVRDHLRRVGQEERWTELQGEVYGGRMNEAEPFPDVLVFFADACRAGIDLWIVSHRSRYPYRGPAYDLHAAALAWLETQGFFDPSRIGMPRENVFLEVAKADKLARIGSLGCTLFIDDLPELLSDPTFPTDVQPILFDPIGGHRSRTELTPASSWAELRLRLLPQKAAER